jgi:L,D-peptidoglycan transpeptidase YkuD (ErfK/YbiS/YcfS/YnhG family)
MLDDLEAKRILAVVALASSLAASACHMSGAPTPKSISPIALAQQLVVVTTPGWDSTTGILHRFERARPGDEWHAVGQATPIVVGRTGLAWGAGFDILADAQSSAPRKREGDGRSPAGAFPLDTAFGFEPLDAAPRLRVPYVSLTDQTDCVDDPASMHYNTVVARDRVPRVDWSSAERMRTIDQYRLGVIVGYNAAPPVPGRGSCIFLHIWAGPSSTTAGCTALDVGALKALVEWLDANRRPMLVQLTADEYRRLRGRWELPEVSAP